MYALSCDCIAAFCSFLFLSLNCYIGSYITLLRVGFKDIVLLSIASILWYLLVDSIYFLSFLRQIVSFPVLHGLAPAYCKSTMSFIYLVNKEIEVISCSHFLPRPFSVIYDLNLLFILFELPF